MALAHTQLLFVLFNFSAANNYWLVLFMRPLPFPFDRFLNTFLNAGLCWELNFLYFSGQWPILNRKRGRGTHTYTCIFMHIDIDIDIYPAGSHNCFCWSALRLDFIYCWLHPFNRKPGQMLCTWFRTFERARKIQEKPDRTLPQQIFDAPSFRLHFQQLIDFLVANRFDRRM